MLLCCMKTIQDVFDKFKTELSTVYDVNEVASLTLLTINEVSGLSNAAIKAFSDRDLTVAQSQKLTDILNELKTGKPIQYILGKTEFFGLPFLVNPLVLIPRPETEELVEWILATIKGNHLQSGKILDIGTGSGCIPIALKKNAPDFDLSAVDISSSALATAQSNASLNQVDIEFIKDDILNPTSQISDLKSQISIIVSNPPYVTLTDKKQMHINVVDFEPHNALFVPEDDPLIFYRAIADFALSALIKPNGFLFFEINESLGKETVQLLGLKGFKNIELKKDMSGRDRMIRCLV